MSREDTQFKPGQSGNPGGRPKIKAWKEALKRQIAKQGDHDAEDKLASGLDKIAKAVVSNAMLGDKESWQEIGNRLDGKVPQAIVGGDEDDAPIKVEGVIRLHKPAQTG